MSESILLADDLSESGLTVGEAACPDDAVILTESIDDQPETTLAEWSGQ